MATTGPAAPIFEMTKFRGMYLRKLIEDNPQIFEELRNLRVTEENVLRVRAGVRKPYPIGGSWHTTNSPLRTGSATSMIVGGHDLRTPWPIIIRESPGPVYTEDQAQQAFMPLFTNAAVNEKCWFLSPGGKFSTVLLNLGRAAADLTIEWRYTSPSGDTLLPGVTDQLNGTGERIIRFSPPTSPTWGGTHVNGYFGFGIYAKITAVGGAPVIPRIARYRITGDFPSHRQLYLADADALVSPTSLRVCRYGASGAEADFPLVDDAGGAGLDTGFNAPVHFASRDGILYYTNGFIQRRHQRDPALNGPIGFTRPGTTNFAFGYAGPPGAPAGLTGTFLYGIAYGYGPNGAWGKGQPRVMATVPAPANQTVCVRFPDDLLATVPGIVDVVYVYRSWPLDGAQAQTYNSQPLYQIAAVERSPTTGLFPLNLLGFTGYDDADQNFPSPLQQMDARDVTPPSRVRFLIPHKNRIIAMSNREYPTRVWPSLAGSYEAFDQFSGNGHQDFSASGGDEITGGADFADMLVVFTNRSMHALVNLDTEDWSPITLHPEIGCVAPASIVVAYGRLFWLSQHGPYMWDGVNEPQPLGWPLRLENLSSVVHGMSRGVAYDNGYEIELIPHDRGVNTYATQWPSALYAPLFEKWHYSLRSQEWTKTQFANAEQLYMQPICTAKWPHFTDYEGREAPVYGRHRVNDGVTDLRCWLGEAGVTDDGTNFAIQIQVLYGPRKAEMFVPERWLIEGKNFGSPACGIPTASVVGDKPVINATPVEDTGTIANSWSCGFTRTGTGVAMISFNFSGNYTGSIERDGYIFGVTLLGRKFPRKQPI